VVLTLSDKTVFVFEVSVMCECVAEANGVNSADKGRNRVGGGSIRYPHYDCSLHDF
jgi:hypothetical protein